MADNLTTQDSDLATIPKGTTLPGYVDVGGVVRFPPEFITGGSAGAWTVQPVDSVNKTHGLPTQSLDGADATLGLTTQAKATDATTASWSVVQLLKAVFGYLLGLALGQGTAAAALRVELPTDGTGVVGLNAGSNVIGGVVGSTVQVSVSPTVTASLYAAGNCVGTSQTLTNACRVTGGQATLQDLVITDKANQRPPLTILFLSAAPAGTYTDKATPTLATDLGVVVGQVLIAAGDWTTSGSDSKAVCNKQNISLVLPNSESTRNLYAVVLTTGTPTPGSTSDYTFKYKFYQD